MFAREQEDDGDYQSSGIVAQWLIYILVKCLFLSFTPFLCAFSLSFSSSHFSIYSQCYFLFVLGFSFYFPLSLLSCGHFVSCSLSIFLAYILSITFIHKDNTLLGISMVTNICYHFPWQETHRSQHDHFHEQLERSAADSFTVVADYLGRGVFTHLQSLSALYPPLNTTRSRRT